MSEKKPPLRILFLATWFPYPPDMGYKIRVYNLLSVLGQRHEITLLSFARPGDVADAKPLREFCRAVYTVSWKPFEPSGLRALAGFFASVPRSLVDTYSPAMQACVQQLAATQTFDVVIASTIELAPYALTVPTRAHVLEEHNFTTRMMLEQYLTQPNRLKRARFWLTWRKFQAYEARLYPRFDACTMVSEVDARAAQKIVRPRVRVSVIPNGVDLRYYRWDDIIAAHDTLVYNGSLTYFANLDAVRYFAAEIFPFVRSQVPTAQLKITGRYDNVSLDGIAMQPGIELTGYLDDVREVLRTSSVCVVPLRVGGGTRFKILEAMALGTPVVATSKGAEGLAVTHGENIFIADTPSDFARYTCELLENPKLRRRLALSARKLVETQYDWNSIGAKFETVLYQTLAGTPL